MGDSAQSYQNRRELLRLIQESQKRESATLRQMGDIAIQHKGKLLTLLSGWLMELSPTGTTPSSHHEEIGTLTQISLERWVMLQEYKSQIETQLDSALAVEREASSAYARHAPLGRVSRWFAETTEKDRIRQLEAEARVARNEREKIERQLTRKATQMQRLGKQFLQDCLDQIDRLGATEALGTEVQSIMGQMATELNAVWSDHASREARALDRMACVVNELRTAIGT